MTTGSLKNLKLSYVATQFRVKVEITKANCAESATPPQDVFERARKKLQSIKAAKEIEYFEIYEDKFKQVWATLRENKDWKGIDVISVTIGEGSPILKGVDVVAPQSDKAVAGVSFDGSIPDPSYWKQEWVLFYVNHLLSRFAPQKKVNPSQLFGAWLKAVGGETIQELQIGSSPILPSKEEIEEKPYVITANKHTKDVTLVIRDLKNLTTASGQNELNDMIRDATAKVAHQFGFPLYILKKELSAAIQSGLTGPEMFGIDMPLVLLVSTAVRKKPIGKLIQTNYPGAGKLNITVSDNGFEAVMVNFDANIYKDKAFSINEEWLKNEIRRFGIDPLLSDPLIALILNRLMRKEDLEGQLVAQGIQARRGTGAYLHPCYLDKKEEKNIDYEKDILDIRSLQKKNVVKEGDLVAEMRYESNPVQGRDVFGNEIDNSHADDFRVKIGEGIKEKRKGKFYAMYDGMPVIEKSNISVSKVMVHEGDVNLRTGNIQFEGPVEITGSIDHGAVVEVKGDLIVRGAIRGAIVRCGGNIEVHAGIATGKKGMVFARNDLKAEFIENSRVQCGGSLTVKKIIINSDIICGGFIELLDQNEGVLAGGTVSSKEDIKTANLGFKNGSITRLNVGVDWHIEASIRIRKARLEKVVALQVADRQALREVMARKKNQMTAKHEERKLYYQNRLVKERALIEKLEKHLASAQALLVYNPESKIFIAQTLYANIEINIGGITVPVKQDMAGVCVLAKSKQGQKIVPIEVVNRMLEKGQEL